jgi:endonuclease/exonuclease/phosphatase family metal-dependent hydrolase
MVHNLTKWKRCLAAVVAVLLVGGAIYHASRHVSSGPAEGTAVEGQVSPGAAERRTFRIGTFNIHGGKGLQGRVDLERTAECLGALRLDCAALSEVHGPALWQTQDQAEQLGRRLGMAWLFAPAVREWYHLEMGNALLTSLPVVFWQRIPLARRYDRSHRNAVLVGLTWQGRTIHLLLTHINRRDDRQRQAQLRAVIALYLALAEPAVLAGDLNSDSDDPQIRQLLATSGVEDPVGRIVGSQSPGEVAAGRIDWIFTRGFRCVEAGIEDHGASDHPLVWAELELPEN